MLYRDSMEYAPTWNDCKEAIELACMCADVKLLEIHYTDPQRASFWIKDSVGEKRLFFVRFKGDRAITTPSETNQPIPGPHKSWR